MNLYQKKPIKVLIIICLLVSSTAWGDALQDYVHSSENNFRWSPVNFSEEPWGTVGHYELISQNWRGHSWKHFLVIVRPKTIRNPDIAFLRISGDGNGQHHINSLRRLAEQGGAVAAVLMNVPNQPLYQNRREDALIAYTFNQYLKTADQSWPLLFPMVKSAVKAMDSVQTIVKLKHDQQINRFVLSGASKRGWTTWLAAAVDNRIAGIAPMVIDTLNMKAQLQWSEQVYGKQSTKIKDYTELNLHRKMDSKIMQQLRSWVDPYTYIQQYTMPKLLLLGTNDPYWTVDSLRHYWDELPEPKMIYQTPNARHNLNGGTQALKTLAAFFELIADQKPLPRIDWQFKHIADSHINAQLKVNQQARKIRLWNTHSKDRDFRDNQWMTQTLNITQDSNHATAAIPIPKSGYQAFLLEVELQTDSGHDFKLSTTARVTPDTQPCHCWRTEKK